MCINNKKVNVRRLASDVRRKTVFNDVKRQTFYKKEEK